MMEHLSAEQLHAYLRGGLPAERLLTIDAHLASCDLCRNNLEINERLTAGISNLRADFRQVADAPLTHLTWEQLAALADQKLDPVEREMAESHLEICGACNTEFAELRQFADHLSTFPIAELSSQSHQSSLKKHATLFSFNEFLVRGKAAFSLPGTLKLACAAALFAIIIWGSFYFLRARNSVVNTPEIAGRETITPAPTITATPHASQSENSTAVLALNDGGKQITLDATGNVTGINFISSADEKLAANALRVGQVETPAELKQLSSPGSGLMGTSRDETFRLISPTGKIVASNRPTLQWQALSGASSYVVTIANPQTNFVLSSETITTTQWKPTEPLPRGQTYTWQVTAIKDGKETKSPLPDAPDAQFRILSQREFDEIAQAEKAYVGNHLMLGLVYARKGLLSESEIHFNALLAANPQSQVAKRLLQDIRINSRR